MFGYVLPMQSEMRVREFRLYKACYCGLCHALGKKYGPVARLILNYDFSFLAMLLWEDDDDVTVTRRRCPASPFRKKQCCESSASLDKCAGYSVILTWWKLRDAISDEPFIKSIPQRLLALLLKRAYKKAAEEHADFDDSVRVSLSALSVIENECGRSLDAAADTFATLLKAAAHGIDEQTGKRRVMEELLYHVGRWIYIIDALDDLPRDMKDGQYNPISERFKPEGELSEGDKLRVETTLRHSAGLAASALELMPEGAWTETVRNTLYLGLPEVMREVLCGEWKQRKKIKNKELDI